MPGEVFFTPAQLIEWGVKLLSKKAFNEEDARTIATVLVKNNLRGIDTHGIDAIRHYARRFSRIETRPISIMKENASTCLIDAGNGSGILASVFAMNKAVEKAKKTGAGVSSVHMSNHFSAAASYPILATEQGCIGIAMTAAGGRIPPFGAKAGFLGNNPLSIGVPGPEFPIVLDMALSTVAFAKIVHHSREGLPMPENWGYDENGEPTTDAKAAHKSGLQAPLGGYKGASLSVMSEMLCSILSQSKIAEDVLEITVYDKPRGCGHFFVAINIEDFLPLDLFKSLAADYSKRFHAVPAKDGQTLYLPGEIEFIKTKDRMANGIPVIPAVIGRLNEVADEFGIEHLA